MTTEDFENSNEVHFNVEITAKNAAFPTLKKRKRLIDEISGSSLSDSPTDDEIDPSLIYRMQGIRQGLLSVVEKFNKVGKGKYFEVVSKDNKVAENDDNFDTNSGAKPSASFHETIMAKKLYASQNELVANKFPLFTAGEIRLGAHPANSSFNWMKLMPQTAKISQRVFGLDCEMVRTIAGLELGRVTVVEHLTLNKFSVVYDKIVKPIHPVLDYLTIYSGLTPKILNSPNAITLELAQSDVFCDLIKNGDVLVGHSLENDFSAMRVAISPNTIIIADTALIYQRSGGGKHGLSFLASNVLQREIQTSGSDGHDSAEDAIASLELVQIRAFGGVEEGYGGNGAAFDNFGEQRFNLVDVINNCEKGKMRGGKVTVVEDEGSGWLKSFSGTNCDCTQKASDLFKPNLFDAPSKNVLVWGKMSLEGGSDADITAFISRVQESTPSNVMVAIIMQRGLNKARELATKRKAVLGKRGTFTWGISEEQSLKVHVENARIGRAFISVGSLE